MRFVSLMIMSCILAACGEEDTNSRQPTPCLLGSGITSGGDGTGVLEVFADLTYSAIDDRLTTDIEVRRNGTVTEGAFVQLIDQQTGQDFAIPQTGSGTATRYRGLLPGYRRLLRLEVTYSSDVVNGTLEGPNSHTITSPANGVTLSLADLGQNLRVEWSPADTVCVDMIDVELGAGSLATSIAADAEFFDLPTSNLSVGAEQVHVIRTTSVKLAGGFGESYFQIGYDASNDIVLHP